ncbi:MAG: hypothetical protein QM809_05150 [Gordonia sp. (in: high G+C Gram-positive bacteria)]|uniref:hypothetical protein n=1 Tax=Gordonia sp. (in: high G+C Gram-positive bacteria) TaxID=84139 RepID=UPI0039E25FF6
MAPDRCWSSIVVGSAEEAALGIGPRESSLVACDLSDGHSGLHSSDGGRGGTGRRTWVMWGDYARSPQPGREIDPCRGRGPGGVFCTLYDGHGGAHRFLAMATAAEPRPGSSAEDSPVSSDTGRVRIDTPPVEHHPVAPPPVSSRWTTEPAPPTTSFVSQAAASPPADPPPADPPTTTLSSVEPASFARPDVAAGTSPHHTPSRPVGPRTSITPPVPTPSADPYHTVASPVVPGDACAARRGARTGERGGAGGS